MKKTVLESMSLMLQPVARLALRHGIKLNDLIEALKIALVQSAHQELKRTQEPSSTSRLSVMSGVHRRDVHRIDKLGDARLEGVSVTGKVIAQWQHQHRYCTKAGKPRTLSVEGDKSEFFELVRSVSSDINPYTVLYELERIGAVDATRGGVRLQVQSHVDRRNIKQGLRYLAQDVDDLVASVDDNLFLDEAVPHLHLKTEYDNLVEEAEPAVKRWLIEEGESFHKRARQFLSKFDRDSHPRLKRSGKRWRVALGTFSRIEEHLSKRKEKRK